MTIVLVRGPGEVGSAVAHNLFRSGHKVVLHDHARAPHSRRGIAFVDALYENIAEFEAKHRLSVARIGTGVTQAVDRT